MNEQNKKIKQNSDDKTNEPNIQPSEPNSGNSNIENKSGDPGRTPGKAEGSRENVEEDLKRKDKQERG